VYGVIDEVAALQAIVNATMEERRARWEAYGAYAAAPVSGRKRIGRRVAWRVRDARQSIALRIAPWLDEW
jgi:hypothetical protein